MANPSYMPKTGRDSSAGATNGSILFFDVGGPAGLNTFEARAYIHSDLALNLGAKPEPVRVYVRGQQISRRNGNDPQLEITFTMPMFQFTNSAQDVILDVMDGTGNINGSWTKHTASCEPWNVGIQIVIEGTDLADAADHKIVLPAMVCDYTWAQNDNGEDVISVTATCEDYNTWKTDAVYGTFGPT